MHVHDAQAATALVAATRGVIAKLSQLMESCGIAPLPRPRLLGALDAIEKAIETAPPGAGFRLAVPVGRA